MSMSTAAHHAANAAAAVLSSVRGLSLQDSERLLSVLPLHSLQAQAPASILPNALATSALKLAISIEPPTHSTEELTALRLLLDISSLPPHHLGDTPGIFRKPGSQERVDALYSELTTFGRLPRLEDRLKRNELSTHDLCGVLKRTLRNICLLSPQTFSAMDIVLGCTDEQRKLELMQIIMLLPSTAARQALQLLVSRILKPIAQRSETNKMTAAALATCIAQTVIQVPERQDEEQLEWATNVANLSNTMMRYLIEHAPAVFEVPESFTDMFGELLSTGDMEDKSAEDLVPHRVQTISDGKIRINEEILVALRTRLERAGDRDRETYREDYIRALYGFCELLGHDEAFAARVEAVQEEIAQLQAEGADSRQASARIKRLASTPRRMLAGMLTPRRKRPSATAAAAAGVADAKRLSSLTAYADSEDEADGFNFVGMPTPPPIGKPLLSDASRRPFGAINQATDSPTLERLAGQETIV